MNLINAIFGILSALCFIFTLYKLFFLISQYKKYELIMSRILIFKKKNNSKNYVRESLISEGFTDYIVDDVLDEYY